MYHKRYTTALTKAITAIKNPNNAPMIALSARTATPLEMLPLPMGITKSIYGMKSLKEEKEQLVTSKNAEYEAYQNARTEQRDLQTVYTNVRKMLGLNDDTRSKRKNDIGIE